MVDKIISIAEKICIAIACIMLAIAVISSFIQVVSRSILGRPLTWTEEVARFSGILMVMFAMGPVFKERGHVGVDFIYNKLPKCLKKYIDIINDAVTIVVMFLFTFYGIILMNNGSRMASPALRIPMSTVYFGLVLGGGFSILFAIYAAAKHTKSIFSEKSEKDIGRR